MPYHAVSAGKSAVAPAACSTTDTRPSGSRSSTLAWMSTHSPGAARTRHVGSGALESVRARRAALAICHTTGGSTASSPVLASVLALVLVRPAIRAIQYLASALIASTAPPAPSRITPGGVAERVPAG